MSPNKIGELMVAKGLINREQLNSALQHSKSSNGRIGSSLVQLGHVNDEVLAAFLAKQYGLTTASLEELNVPVQVIALIPRGLCEKHVLVPIGQDGNRIQIAIADPTNISAVDDVRFLTNMDIIVFLSTEAAIRAAIERVFISERANAALSDLEDEVRPEGVDEKTFVEIGVEKEAQDLEGAGGDQSAPIIKLINTLLSDAIKRRVSDIHIEPYEQFIRIRFRIDGSLHEIMKVPSQYRAALPARVKVMAGLDISEKRLPQDGRIQVRKRDSKVDIRVSVIPTILGEKVVMRILDQGSTTPTLTGIGFEADQLKLFKKAALQPYGMVLVTGPTGSGKSTTLYAALSELNQPDTNISTVEDPVEYRMLGVNQIQMKDSIGLNFATSLRSLLRQDPDILMVGEIRDQETAEIAIKCALTGHMVFSTLHTNDAASTITRLVHMGVEPFLITAALTLVQAQRLIRVICPNCSGPDSKVSTQEIIEAGMPKDWIPKFQPKRGKGCENCGKTGYRGRKGIFEVMYLTEKIRQMIVKGANSDQLKIVAMKEGMTTLRQHALIKLFRGETTLEEVLSNSRPDDDLTMN